MMEESDRILSFIRPECGKEAECWLFRWVTYDKIKRIVTAER